MERASEGSNGGKNPGFLGGNEKIPKPSHEEHRKTIITLELFGSNGSDTIKGTRGQKTVNLDRGLVTTNH